MPQTLHLDMDQPFTDECDDCHKVKPIKDVTILRPEGPSDWRLCESCTPLGEWRCYPRRASKPLAPAHDLTEEQVWDSSDWRACLGRLIGHHEFEGYTIATKGRWFVVMYMGEQKGRPHKSLSKALIATGWAPAFLPNAKGYYRRGVEGYSLALFAR